MAKRDYYEVLGVSRDANQDQVKKAYRQAAVQFHPDKNPGDKASEEKFKEATEAYQVLSSDENRRRYDQFGHAAFDGQMNGFGDFSQFAEDIFGDLFGAFFGSSGGGGRKGRRGGRDLRYNLEITLEEAALGGEKEITIPRPERCEPCSGTGGRDGKAPESCRQCSGTGQVRFQQGFFAISRPCSSCNGQGRVISDPCPHCGGSGRKAKDVKISVKIPAGIDQGQRLKLRGEGEPSDSDSGPAGDLYVEISLKPHKFFHRQETEIISEVPISYAQAVLGGEMTVRTLDGETSLKIPAGTPSGKVFRLRGKGIVNLHTGHRGDHHVRTYVYVSGKVTPRQRELLQELSAIEGEPTADESRSFFDKVKEFFE